MTSTTQTDMSLGVGILFSLLAIGAAAATLIFGYQYAIEHTRAIQINAGIAFGVAMLAAGLAVTAIHLYDN